MFLAAKVGITAFKVGKIAANAKETFSSLIGEIDLWKVQLDYYTSYFNEVYSFIPESLHILATSRLKVLKSYIDRLLAKIEKAEGGNKKAKMTLIGKSSGEMGTTFTADVALMFANLDECIQFSQVHITSNRILQLKAIDDQLKALGQPGIAAVEQQKFHHMPVEIVVQSRRLIFLLEWPMEKIAVGAKVPIAWTVAGDIPFVRIDIQVSSLMQQAQDKNKKKYVLVADKVASDKTGAGSYMWEVPKDFVFVYNKHTNYFLRLTYTPSDNKDHKSQFKTKVKTISETFKIYDPAKKEKKEESKSPLSSSSSSLSSSQDRTKSPPPTSSTSPTSPSSSLGSSQEKEKEKEKEKGGMMGKASGMIGGFKKKF